MRDAIRHLRNCPLAGNRPVTRRHNRYRSRLMALDNEIVAKLQAILKLVHTDDERAIGELTKLVLSGEAYNSDPTGPLAHVLSALISNGNVAVCAYATRILKNSVVDDKRRSLAVDSGLIPHIITAFDNCCNKWDSDPSCMVEILGVFQTLFCDEKTAKVVIDVAGLEAVGAVVKMLGDKSKEIRMLCTATLANLLAHSGSPLLLNDRELSLTLESAIPLLVEIGTSGQMKETRTFAVAALANACLHPSLAQSVLSSKGKVLLENIISVHGVSTEKIVSCASTGLDRLDNKNIEDGKKSSGKTYVFKWGAREAGNRLDAMGKMILLVLPAIVVLTMYLSSDMLLAVR